MKTRMITGAILLLILIPIVIIGNLPFYIFMGLFVAIATYEMLNLFKIVDNMPLVLKIICIILSEGAYVVLSVLWNQNEIQAYNFDIYPVYIAYLFFSTVILLSIFVFVSDFKLSDVAKIFLIIQYVAFGFSALSFLRELGARFIIYLLIVTFATDVFAYLFGITFGKHKMCPTISPKKSWEGAIGGTLCGTLLGTVFAFYYGDLFSGEFLNAEGNMTLLDNFCSLGENRDVTQFFVILVITLLVSILGQIGDLVASKMKRQYDIKDFGKVFPGHGGVLDRFDSSIFVAMSLVAIFILLRIFFPIPII